MSRARQLQEVATAAFFDQVLPAVHAELPQVASKITVLITSSVAYGVADELSDLDVFIVFHREADYRQHAVRLARLIEELRLDDRYPDVCDKGVRFELESLSRSDVRSVFSHPESPRHWMRQTDWLMHWFGSALPIYDPAGIRMRFDRRCSFYPPQVASWRTASGAFRSWRHALTASRALSEAGLSFLVVRQLWRSMTTALDLAYLRGHSYGPHPKWRAQLARRLLGAGGDLKVLCRVMNQVVVAIGGNGAARAVETATRDLRSWAEVVGTEVEVAPLPPEVTSVRDLAFHWCVQRGLDHQRPAGLTTRDSRGHAVRRLGLS